MAQRSSYDAGTFCWVDLSTVDVGASVDFYRRVFGWTADGHEGTGYVIFQKDGVAVAGLMEINEEQRAGGVPPFWNTYVTVQDADATAARVTELGGAVHVPPFDIETTGRTAVVADPQGAVFMLWQPRDFAGAALVNTEGAWAWSDLQTSDVDGAIAFYPELFGWQIAEVPGSGGQYFSISSRGRAIGGVMPAGAGTPRPYWAVYFGVHSAGAALEHAEAAGGERLAGPIDVPAGRFAFASDPLGAVFAVFEGDFDA
jgi:uncharacterized protein